MAGSHFPSSSARVVAALALTVAAVATLPVASSAFKPPAGETCNCALASSAGACVVLEAYKRGSTTVGMCRAGGKDCEAPWECTNASPTHVCLSMAVTSSLRCEPGTGGGTRCPCSRNKVNDVSLVPTQKLPGGSRSGGGKPVGPLPLPQEPLCKANYAILSVEGKPWQCVQSMNIGDKTVAQAYDYRHAMNNGWETNDDYVNLNFLRDAASRLYLCVTYGSCDASDAPTPWRTASSKVTSAVPNRYYLQDAEAKTDNDGEANGDWYAPANGNPAHELSASHRWKDDTTDGYCVGVARNMRLDFSGLSYIKGLALGMGSDEPYPKTGDWKFWDMDAQPRTELMAYDAAGRVYPAEKQVKKWKGSQPVPTNCIYHVTVTAACSCNGWEEKAEGAADAVTA